MSALSIFDIDISEVFGTDKSAEFIQFTIVRAREKRLYISVHKDHSLWDFYEKCYFTIYPEEQFSTTRDAITPENVPHIYDIFMHDEKADTIKSIPVHRFITLSDYMKCNESYFNQNKKRHVIYVIDEKFIQRQYYPENNEVESVSSQIGKTIARYNCLLGKNSQPT
jgi:hypothetical protein